MKKRFKILSSLLGIMFMLVTAFVLWAVPAHAAANFGDGTATSSPSVTVTLEVYDAEDYEILNLFKENDVDTASYEIETYENYLASDGVAKAEQYWNGELANTSNNPANEEYASFGFINATFTYKNKGKQFRD